MKRFYAASSREAMRQVKRDLGPDSVILSNRRVEGGVEILALPHTEARALESAARGAVPREAPVRSALNNPAVHTPFGAPSNAPVVKAPTWVATPPKPEAAEQVVRGVMQEMRSIRQVINEQLSGLVLGEMQRREPDKLRIMSRLLSAGFSPALARRLLDKAPAGRGQPDLMAWIRKALDKNLITAGVDEMVAKGGVYALIGPTGVGKTTTTAKLAARCVVRHGAENLALLTTDNYRVGAHEHLRIYGRILGVTVHAARDAQDLRLALAGLRNKHMVLIDTVGMSQRDRNVAEQIAMLEDPAGLIKRLLLINCTCQGDTLEDVLRIYRGTGSYGAILTKADEALSLGTALDAVIRHRLPVHYVANGQRVPEDLHPVNRGVLLDRALANRRDNDAREFLEQDMPAAMFGVQPAL